MANWNTVSTSLTTTQITSFVTNANAALNTVQVAALTSSQIQVLTTTQLQSLSLANPLLDGEIHSVNANVTAGTNNQGQASLTSDINVITTTGSNPSGATLLSNTGGRKVVVINLGTHIVNIYPASGGYIDSLAQNASIALPQLSAATNYVLEFISYDGVHWQSAYYDKVNYSTYATNIAGGAGGSIPYQGNISNTSMLAQGTAGQILTCNPITTAPVWSALTSTQISALTSTAIQAFTSTQLQVLTTAQLINMSAGGSGALTSTQLANLTSAQVNVLTTSQLFALTNHAQSFTKPQVSAITALSVSSNLVAVDMSMSNDFSLTLQATTSQQLSNPTNTTNGQCGTIYITQNGTPSTLTFGTSWVEETTGVAGIVSTTASAQNLLHYIVFDSTHIYYTLNTHGVA